MEGHLLAPNLCDFVGELCCHIMIGHLVGAGQTIWQVAKERTCLCNWPLSVIKLFWTGTVLSRILQTAAKITLMTQG
jgi:hypothetical protein